MKKTSENFKYPEFFNNTQWHTNILVQKPKILAMPLLILQIRVITRFDFLRKIPNVFLRGLYVFY